MSVKFIIRGVIISLLCIMVNIMQLDCALASEKIESSSYSISEFEILEDPAGFSSFEEISTADYGKQYRKYPGEVISLGITKSVYWIRFKVLSHTVDKHDNGKFLQLKNANIDKIDIYIPANKKGFAEDNQYVVKKVGVSRPNDNRDIMDNTWVFQLPNEMNAEKDIYLRLESASALRLPIICWNSDGFIAESFLKNLGFGAFYGIMLGMLSFNLFIYFVLRDKTYLFYVSYIGFMFLYQFQVHGHLKMLIDIPYKIYNAVFWLWLAGAFISSVYFTRQFLQVKTTVPSLDKILTGLVLIAILQGAIGIFGYNLWANHMAHGLGIIGPVFFMVLAIIRFHQGFRSARYYIFAWGVLSVGIVAWTLSAYMPGIVSGVNYLLLATAGESLLLSFALADRVKILRTTGEVLNKRIQWYQDLSITDEMTGLYNKRFFNTKMNEETACALEADKPMAVMVLDIDHFKIYNDSYGHWEGDQVIIRIGAILSNLVEEGQWAFRYGGEEFVLLLPNTRCDDAYLLAEKFQNIVREQEFTPGMTLSIAITVSIGLTELRPNDNNETVFQRADEALYKAKKNGRNQIVIL